MFERTGRSISQQAVLLDWLNSRETISIFINRQFGAVDVSKMINKIDIQKPIKFFFPFAKDLAPQFLRSRNLETEASVNLFLGTIYRSIIRTPRSAAAFAYELQTLKYMARDCEADILALTFSPEVEKVRRLLRISQNEN